MSNWFFTWWFRDEAESSSSELMAEMSNYFMAHNTTERAERALPVYMQDSDAAHEYVEQLLLYASNSDEVKLSLADFLVVNNWLIDAENYTRFKAALIRFAIYDNVWLRSHYRLLFDNADLIIDANKALELIDYTNNFAV